tara:strand:- start:2836 stop:3012 length:177 start_codon:yes stop_codon:yes gene_type:complete
MKVTSIKYFETSRGVGYEAKTDEGVIWNNGDGGATYHIPDVGLDEFQLEELIDVFEGV